MPLSAPRLWIVATPLGNPGDLSPRARAVLAEADLIRLGATEPARVFNLPVNTFEPGAPADSFLFDPDLEWQVTPETLYSKSHNTPWLGQSLKGRVAAHWIGGVKIV